MTAGEKAQVGAILPGFTGALAETVAGLVLPRSRWEVASVPSARATLSPAAPDGRPGAVLTVRF